MVIGGNGTDGDPGIAVLDGKADAVDLGPFGYERRMRVVANVDHDLSALGDPAALGERVRWLVDNAHNTVSFAPTDGGTAVVLHMRSDAGGAFEAGDEVTFHVRKTRPGAYPVLVAITPSTAVPAPGPR